MPHKTKNPRFYNKKEETRVAPSTEKRCKCSDYALIMQYINVLNVKTPPKYRQTLTLFNQNPPFLSLLR